MITPCTNQNSVNNVTDQRSAETESLGCPTASWSPRTARSRMAAASAAVLISLTSLGAVLALFDSADDGQAFAQESDPVRQRSLHSPALPQPMLERVVRV